MRSGAIDTAKLNRRRGVIGRESDRQAIGEGELFERRRTHRRGGRRVRHLACREPAGWLDHPADHALWSGHAFRHVAVNREESAIGLCSGAFLQRHRRVRLDGRSGIPHLHLCHHQDQLHIPDPAVDRHYVARPPRRRREIPSVERALSRAGDAGDRHSVRRRSSAAPTSRGSRPRIKHSRVLSRPVVVGFTREMLRGEA